MNKILLLNITEDMEEPYNQRFSKLTSSQKKYSTTKDPDEADYIIFIRSENPYFKEALNSIYWKKYKSKCFMIYDGDRFAPFIPGIYASTNKIWYTRKRYRTGNYVGVKENEYFIFYDNYNEMEYLYSFIGSTKNHKVREDISKIKYEHAYIHDSSNDRNNFLNDKKGQRNNYKQPYVDIVRSSKFVLCPRGFGTSSFRLFETMIIGRVPVIISDNWVPTEGPAWDEFSIRIKEKDVKNIPNILEERANEYETMGRKARSEWDKFYSDENLLDTYIGYFSNIAEVRGNSEKYLRFLPSLFYLHPYHFFRKNVKYNILKENKSKYNFVPIMLKNMNDE